jgi:hypothetical protein
MRPATAQEESTAHEMVANLQVCVRAAVALFKVV